MGRRKEDLAGTHTFPRHRHHRLPGSSGHGVSADNLVRVRCDGDRSKLGSRSLSLPHSGNWDLHPDRPHIRAHFTKLNLREVREKSF